MLRHRLVVPQRSANGRGLVVDQAGVVPYRLRLGRVEVLLITSRKRGRWIVPKGHIEPDLTARASACAEAYEEAGVQGTLDPIPLGCYAHGEPPVHMVQIFLMRVEQELTSWPEQEERSRRWMPLRIAQASVDEDGLGSLLAVMAELLY